MADNVAIADFAAASTPIATEEVTTLNGSVVSARHIQRVGLSALTADGVAVDVITKKSQANTFTSTGAGTVIDVSLVGMSRLALQVKQTGTVTAWTVVVYASLDGVNYDTTYPILKHMKTGDGTETVAGDLTICYTATPYPLLYVKTQCTALTLGAGTNVIATLVALS